MVKGHIEAGAGEVRAEFSVGVGAKGPNASVDVGIDTGGAELMVRGEFGSGSVHAGPLGVKVGLGGDTGASVGSDGVEVKLLGTGFSIGRKTSVAVLGSEVAVTCSVM